MQLRSWEGRVGLSDFLLVGGHAIKHPLRKSRLHFELEGKPLKEAHHVGVA